MPLGQDLQDTPLARVGQGHGDDLESFDAGEMQRDLYEEIAERRAQLECAETLRRVRAL